MKIAFHIDKATGKASMEVDGIKGPACLAKTEAIRRKLAADAPLRRKPEFKDIAICRNQNISS